MDESKGLVVSFMQGWHRGATVYYKFCYDDMLSNMNVSRQVWLIFSKCGQPTEGILQYSQSA